MTYHIDNLKPGMSESFAKQVSERDVELFGEISGDVNPVHFDEAFAKKTIFRGRVAHGALTLSLLSTVVGMKLPGPGSVVLNIKIDFKAPVRIGDTVVATCTVREFVGKRQVVFDCVCRVGEMVVAEGEALVMPPMRPR
jgi:3-hydroxybutyryl-CoA dehydratase